MAQSAHPTVAAVNTATTHATQTLTGYEALVKTLDREAAALREACRVLEQVVGKKADKIQQQTATIAELDGQLQEMTQQRNTAVELNAAKDEIIAKQTSEIERLTALLQAATVAHETAQKMLEAFTQSLQPHAAVPATMYARQQQRGNFDDILARAKALEDADNKNNS